MSDTLTNPVAPWAEPPPRRTPAPRGSRALPIPDGGFTREWAATTYAVGYGTANHFSREAALLIEHLGVDVALTGDVVELEGLNHSGGYWQRRRQLVLRAQRHLRKFHGLPEVLEQ